MWYWSFIVLIGFRKVYGIGNNNYSQLGFPFNQQSKYKMNPSCID